MNNKFYSLLLVTIISSSFVGSTHSMLQQAFRATSKFARCAAEATNHAIAAPKAVRAPKASYHATTEEWAFTTLRRKNLRNKAYIIALLTFIADDKLNEGKALKYGCLELTELLLSLKTNKPSAPTNEPHHRATVNSMPPALTPSTPDTTNPTESEAKPEETIDNNIQA